MHGLPIPESVSEHKIKEDCIYEQLSQRRLLATDDHFHPWRIFANVCSW